MSVGEDNLVDVHLFRGVDSVPIQLRPRTTVRHDDGFWLSIHDGAINVPRARAGLGATEEDITHTTLLRRIRAQPNRVVFATCAAVCERLKGNRTLGSFECKCPLASLLWHLGSYYQC